MNIVIKADKNHSGQGQLKEQWWQERKNKQKVKNKQLSSESVRKVKHHTNGNQE